MEEPQTTRLRVLLRPSANGPGDATNHSFWERMTAGDRL